jgi:hypothetical protein
MVKVITYAADVMTGDRLPTGIVTDTTEDNGLVTLTVSAYPGSVIEECIVMRSNDHVVIIED